MKKYIVTDINDVAHDLDFENVCDIQTVLRIFSELRRLKTEYYKNYNRGECYVCGRSKRKEDLIKHKICKAVFNMPCLECLDETLEKMEKVSVPITDYRRKK